MNTISRRRFIRDAAGACAVGTVLPGLAPSLAFASGEPPAGDTLVLVVLRGGLDGLSAVVPAGDGDYHRARRHTAVGEGQVIGLDGRFGLHPALAPLAEHYRSGELAVVVAVGGPDDSRSHFTQQGVLETGVPGAAADSGWLARHLASRPGSGVIRTVGLAGQRPIVLAGADDALVANDLHALVADHGLGAAPGADGVLAGLVSGSPLAPSMVSALAAARHLAGVSPDAAPANGAGYDRADPWHRQLRQVAQLLHSGAGLEAAVLDLGGWDTHAGQGDGERGTLRDLLGRFGRGISAFYTDIAGLRHRVTVVAISEFGRTVSENASGGTDHGRGGVAFALGGGVDGGRVVGEWPGLAPDALDGGDVPVATDFRHVLAEVVARRLGNPALEAVFPGHQPRFPGLTR